MSDVHFATTLHETMAAVGQAVAEVFSVVTYRTEAQPTLSEADFADHARLHHLDLAHSIIARDAGGNLVGVAVLGRRVTRAGAAISASYLPGVDKVSATV